MSLHRSLRGAVAKGQRKFGAAATIFFAVSKNPAKNGRGFSFAGEGLAALTVSVFCDDGRRGCAELIADAELDLVLSEMMLNKQ